MLPSILPRVEDGLDPLESASLGHQPENIRQGAVPSPLALQGLLEPVHQKLREILVAPALHLLQGIEGPEDIVEGIPVRRNEWQRAAGELGDRNIPFQLFLRYLWRPFLSQIDEHVIRKKGARGESSPPFLRDGIRNKWLKEDLAEVHVEESGPGLFLIVREPVMQREIQVGQVLDLIQTHLRNALSAQQSFDHLRLHIGGIEVSLEIEAVHLQRSAARAISLLRLEDVAEEEEVLFLLLHPESDLHAFGSAQPGTGGQ